jgi:hypothetical protein
VRPQYSLILVQVSVDEATCQYVQSSMVSGAAVVGGSTSYWAATRAGTTARPRANEKIMMEVFRVLGILPTIDDSLEVYY